jgi:hypothetical protein
MQEQVSHDSRHRERVAANVYRRTTKRGEVVYEVAFRDVDGRLRRRRLDARSERSAIKEARGILSSRDGRDRVVPADVTLGAFWAVEGVEVSTVGRRFAVIPAC